MNKNLKGALIVGVILVSLIIIVSSCTGKKYKPELAKLNDIYRSNTNKASDGSNAVINVQKVELKGNDVIINIGAPGTEEMKFAFSKYIAFKVMDEKGEELKLDKIITSDDNNFTFVVKGNFSKAKYVQIIPYSNGNDFVVYEINK